MKLLYPKFITKLRETSDKKKSNPGRNSTEPKIIWNKQLSTTSNTKTQKVWFNTKLQIKAKLQSKPNVRNS